MEGQPLKVSRKDLDTERRRDTNHSYHQTPRNPTSGIRWNGKNYRTHQPTILLAKDKTRYQTIEKRKLRHLSKNQGGPTCTLRTPAAKQDPRWTMEINRYGLHHGPAEIRGICHHTDGHRSAKQNEPFHSMLEGPRCTAVRQSFHERNSQATGTTT